MKQFLPITLILTLTLLSCHPVAYSDTKSCDDLTDAACRSFGNNEEIFAAYGEEQLTYFFGDTSLPTDYALRYTRPSEDIGEVGIFHTKSHKEAEEMKQIVRDYLEEMRDTQSSFIASYAPEELPKLENAEVRVYGNYVAYAILTEEDRTLFFDAVQRMLTEE